MLILKNYSFYLIMFVSYHYKTQKLIKDIYL